jgi:hypothetical protein
MKKLVGILTLLVCTFALIRPIDQTLANTKRTEQLNVPIRVAKANTCQTILTRAMNTLQSACDGTRRNQICYGNYRISAVLNAGSQVQFSSIGDIVRLSDIRALTTSPLDEDKGIWGLSLMKLQANLPDTLPGQNVTFIVFGDTHVDNLTGDMRSFYFTSGLGMTSCKELPKDSIIVKSPNHTKVTFEANGTQITIASTILLRAVKGQRMTVALVEGQAEVTNMQGSQTLKPGEQTTVQLGGSSGFEPVEAPSDPTEFSDITDPTTLSMIDLAQEMSGEASATDEPLTATEEAPVATDDSISNTDATVESSETPTYTPTPSETPKLTNTPRPTKIIPPTRVPRATRIAPTRAPIVTKVPRSTNAPPPTNAPHSPNDSPPKDPPKGPKKP